MDGLGKQPRSNRGNIVPLSGGPVLVTIAKQNPIYVDYPVAEAKLPVVRDYLQRGPLRSGKPASAPIAPSVRTGEFSFFDNTVQPGNGTVRLQAVLPNSDHLFWPGQFVSVRLVLDTLKAPCWCRQRPCRWARSKISSS